MTTSNDPFGISDFWRKSLAEEGSPQRAAYFGYQDQQRSPNQKRFFQNQFSNVQNQYMGQLGQQIMGGGAPDLNFTDFLSQYFSPQGGAAQAWGGMSPGQRGLDFGRFAPPTRWRV